MKYYSRIENDTVFCKHNEIEEFITIKNNKEMLYKLGRQENLSKASIVDNKVDLSLLTKKNEVGHGSGINWGHRRDGRKREPNQAYIPLPRNIAKNGFFPLDKQHFSVLTDDGRQLILRVEQQGDKAITTPHNNSLLGEYLRNRMDLSNGAFITKENLVEYGRTNITFEKIDDEQFYMDFSVYKQETDA
ncbi:hypothetical protein FACS189425_02020 [Clostridia bacterium]|nr:hypothetical protein FACS189425_02020 [Clostridia bacterium]